MSIVEVKLRKRYVIVLVLSDQLQFLFDLIWYSELRHQGLLAKEKQAHNNET